MKVHEIPVRTSQRYEFVSITDEVRRTVRESGMEEGICLISSTHTTAAVTVNEDYDRDVPRDLAAACEALMESLDVRFEHAEGNSDSHFLTSLFGGRSSCSCGEESWTWGAGRAYSWQSSTAHGRGPCASWSSRRVGRMFSGRSFR
jgi:secondary thiamine-phosphate synthase enzyme